MNKSHGLDCIFNNMLLHIETNYMYFLTILINCMLNFRMFLVCCKKWLNICFDPKTEKGQTRRALSSFRPTSHLSWLSKVYEYVVAYRQKEIITSNLIIISDQFGFSPKHSTQHQLSRITKLVYEVLKIKEKVGTVFVGIANVLAWL